MTEIYLTSRRTRVSPLDIGQKLLKTVENWRRRSRERYWLSKMPAYQLKDIGISEAVRDWESTKPFWKI